MAKSHFLSSQAEHSLANSPALATRVADLLEQLTGDKRTLFYTRIAYLLREMQGQDGFDNLTHDFLDELFGQQQYPAVVAFVDQLRDMPGFRSLLWLKRLLAEGKVTVKERAHRILINHIRNHRWRQPDILDELATWIRPGISEMDRPSELENTVFHIFIELCVRSIDIVSFDQYGLRYSLFPVFLSESERLSPAASLRCSLQVLCHPAQSLIWSAQAWEAAAGLLSQRWFVDLAGESIITSDSASVGLRQIAHSPHRAPEPQVQFDLFISLLIVEWTAIIFGLESAGQPRPGAESVLDAMLQTVAASLTRKRCRRLIQLWRGQKQLLREQSMALRNYDRKVARVIGARRGLLTQLINRLHACAASSRT